MKLKVIHHGIVVALCAIAIIYHLNYSVEKITDPYMLAILWLLFAIGAYHSGVAIGKIVNDDQ